MATKTSRIEEINPPDPLDGGTPTFRPTLTITCPVDGGHGDNPVPLQGRAWDPQDGALGHQIEWSSSEQGHLGTGRSLRVKLPPVVQTITATVTDSEGNTATASVSIEVITGAENFHWVGDNGEGGEDGGEGGV